MSESEVASRHWWCTPPAVVTALICGVLFWYPPLRHDGGEVSLELVVLIFTDSGWSVAWDVLLCMIGAGFSAVVVLGAFGRFIAAERRAVEGSARPPGGS